MANAQAVCTSFKVEVLQGKHALGTTVARGGTTKDTIKAALYLASASLGAATTVYSTTGEVTDSVSPSGYIAGGATVTNATEPSSSGTTSFWTPSAALTWTNCTLASFDAVLFYNSTQSSAAVAVFTFGPQTVTAGNFTLNMPTNDATTGLLRLA